MNLSIAITAARQGACVANYVEVVDLLKSDKPQVECGGDEVIPTLQGAVVVDSQTGLVLLIYVKE